MLFVLLAFFLVVQQRSSTIKQEIYLREVEGVGNIISQEISLAGQVRFGYTRKFSLPSTVGGEQYDLALANGQEFSVRRKFSGDDYVVFLPSQIVIYDNSPGKFCYSPFGSLTPGKDYFIVKRMMGGAERIGIYPFYGFTSEPAANICP
jgi:hypothetical protein